MSGETSRREEMAVQGVDEKRCRVEGWARRKRISCWGGAIPEGSRMCMQDPLPDRSCVGMRNL
jgi:hypothetical protein